MFGHFGRNWAPEVQTFFSATMSPAERVLQLEHKRYPSRISVPSRGFCFLGKHDLAKAVVFGSAFLAGALVFSAKPAKNVVFGVGVPSRGFCFLSKTWPEKAVVRGIGVLSRGCCFLGKT